MASSQPVENWLQRLEDFAVKTSQFAQRKRALPKRANLLPIVVTCAHVSKALHTRLEPDDTANGWGREWR